MIETFIDDIPIEPVTQTPFNTFQFIFGVYDHLVFQILFYMISVTIAIVCVYFSVYLLKKLIGLFKK